MAASSPHFELDISKLKEFHDFHFPNQPVPEIHGVNSMKDQTRDKDVAQEETEEYDNGLGYYEDGVKRILTDEEIEIFRHSEIERLLAAKRREAETREEEGPQRKDEKRNSETNQPGPRTSMGSSKKYATEPNRVNGRGKRKTYFDEPQEENGDVALEY